MLKNNNNKKENKQRSKSTTNAEQSSILTIYSSTISWDKLGICGVDLFNLLLHPFNMDHKFSQARSYFFFFFSFSCFLWEERYFIEQTGKTKKKIQCEPAVHTRRIDVQEWKEQSRQTQKMTNKWQPSNSTEWEDRLTPLKKKPKKKNDRQVPPFLHPWLYNPQRFDSSLHLNVQLLPKWLLLRQSTSETWYVILELKNL